MGGIFSDLISLVSGSIGIPQSLGMNRNVSIFLSQADRLYLLMATINRQLFLAASDSWPRFLEENLRNSFESAGIEMQLDIIMQSLWCCNGKPKLDHKLKQLNYHFHNKLTAWIAEIRQGFSDIHSNM